MKLSIMFKINYIIMPYFSFSIKTKFYRKQLLEMPSKSGKQSEVNKVYFSKNTTFVEKFK